MSTDVEVCNMALARLGQTTIDSLSDTGVLADQCNLNYEQTFYDLLGSYEWPFAVTRAQAGLVDGGVNYTPYAYKYNVPADSLKLINILNADYTDSVAEWVIEGNILYTDEINPLYVKYIDRTVDITNVPESFIEPLYLRLASKMCIKITQDQSLLTALLQEYAAAFQTALAVLGANDRQAHQPDAWWTD